MPLGGFVPAPLPLGGTSLDGLTAEQHARLAADLAACVRTAPFAVLHVDAFFNQPQAYISQYGVGLAAAPSTTFVGVGDIRVIWNPSYKDEYDISWPVNIKQAKATPVGSFARFCTAELVNAKEVRVRTWLHNGTASSDGFFLTVW